MTNAFDLSSLLASLIAAERFAGCSDWVTVTTDQDIVVRWLTTFRDTIAKMNGIKAMASQNDVQLNEFLKSEGFKERFQPFIGRRFGSVGICRMTLTWDTAKEVTTIKSQGGQEYAGFVLPSEIVKVYTTPFYGTDSMLLNLRSNLWLFVPSSHTLFNPECWPHPPNVAMPSSLAMAQLAMNVMHNKQKVESKFDEFVLPTVHLRMAPDISFLTQMLLGEYLLDMAVQELEFGMDESGAAGAAAMSLGFLGLPNQCVIDKPFYVWWTQDGHETVPILSCYLDYDSWKPAKESNAS